MSFRKSNNQKNSYEVEAIIGKRIQPNFQTKEDNIEYCVKWKGYSNTTWEPLKNLANCLGKLEKYLVEQEKERMNETKELKLLKKKRNHSNEQYTKNHKKKIVPSDELSTFENDRQSRNNLNSPNNNYNLRLSNIIKQRNNNINNNIDQNPKNKKNENKPRQNKEKSQIKNNSISPVLIEESSSTERKMIKQKGNLSVQKLSKINLIEKNDEPGSKSEQKQTKNKNLRFWKNENNNEMKILEISSLKIPTNISEPFIATVKYQKNKKIGIKKLDFFGGNIPKKYIEDYLKLIFCNNDNNDYIPYFCNDFK